MRKNTDATIDEDDPNQLDMLDVLGMKTDAFGQPYDYKPVTWNLCKKSLEGDKHGT